MMILASSTTLADESNRWSVLSSQGGIPRMKRIYVPTKHPDDWQRFLAQPEKQWRSGYSAKELAECWEMANGFPSEFQELFTKSGNPALWQLELLFAIPEYKVILPGGKRASQNDLFVLARAKDDQLVTIAVEGKVSESFGPTLKAWLIGASNGKRVRLKFLCDILGLSSEPPLDIRYQLFHRTASAIIESKRFNARYAMMIIHSFSSVHKGLVEYQNFLSLFGVSGRANELVKLPNPRNVSVYIGWVTGKPKTG
jgi:hypothetical protein